MVAVIVGGDAHCDVGSPPHRAEAMSVLSAARALQCCGGMNVHAEVILPSDAAGGIAMVAVIVAADAHCDVGSPPHRADAMPAIRAADGVGALRCCCGDMNAHAAVIRPSDAAGGIAMVAVIVVGDAHCDVGSPPHRAEAMPVLSAARALRCC